VTNILFLEMLDTLKWLVASLCYNRHRSLYLYRMCN